MKANKYAILMLLLAATHVALASETLVFTTDGSRLGAALIPISAAGLYSLEIDYQGNTPQTIQISLFDSETKLNSGFFVDGNLILEKSNNRLRTHRILFWSSGESPTLELRSDGAFQTGKIRVFRLNERFFSKSASEKPPRLYIAFNEQLGDLNRLTDYFTYAGYNGAIVPVLANQDEISIFEKKNLLYIPLIGCQKSETDIRREFEETVEKYGKSANFGGVAIQLFPKSEGQLPPDGRDINEETAARFLAETNKTVPSDVVDKAAYIREKHRETWLNWRAKKVTAFYEELQKSLVKVNPEAKIYIIGATMFDDAKIHERIAPTLLKKQFFSQTLLLAGLDLQELSKNAGIVFIRPVRLDEPSSVFSQEQSEAIANGSHFYHGNLVPSDHQNRKRFIRSLSQGESYLFVDGGKNLPIGQEESLRELLATFCNLPAVPFKTYAQDYATKPMGDINLASLQQTQELSSMQPIVVRTASTADESWIYVLNDSPFHVGAKLHIQAKADSKLTDVSGLRSVDVDGALRWTAALRPYDLIAVRISDPNAVIKHVDVLRPAQIAETLKLKLIEFGEKIKESRKGVPFDMDEKTLVFSVPESGRLFVTGLINVNDPQITAVLEGNDFFRTMRVTRQPNAETESKQFSFILPFANLPRGEMKLRFEPESELTVERLKYYSVAFTDQERTELAKILSIAAMRLDEGRFSDCIAILESYWPMYVFRHVPLPPQNLALAPVAKAYAVKADEKPKSAGFWSQFINWVLGD